MPATLFVVSTPIGNLEDITLRALRTLREVAVIAAEDTRRTGHLLQHYEIRTPMVSLHEHNERERTPGLLARLQAGESVALVSDAGTPLLSDPGFHLVREALAPGFPCNRCPAPRPSRPRWRYRGSRSTGSRSSGFPPARSGPAGGVVRRAGRTSPERSCCSRRRIASAPTLEDVRTHLGERFVVLARELTKVHETVSRGWVSELLAGDARRARRVRRFWYLTKFAQPSTAARAESATSELARSSLVRMTKSGAYSARDAVAALAEQLPTSRSSVSTRPTARESARCSGVHDIGDHSCPVH